MLYEPDNKKDWATDDDVMAHGNPLALELKMVWEDLLRKRNGAINREKLRENFLTKHCNIAYQGAGTETYVSIDEVKACRTEEIKWTGREVYVAVDLSMTNDNCSVTMSAESCGDILSKTMTFIPEGRIDEKTEFEKFDYRASIVSGDCIACGDMTIDYGVVEDYVFSIEEKFGVIIKAIGYDRYNALSSAQKWEKKYTVIEIRQHSDTLHPPTKLLAEKIANKEWHYENNRLLETNFENAKCTYDTNLNRYVNKKKSNGKVDAVVSTINSVYLLQQDVLFGNEVVVQVI